MLTIKSSGMLLAMAAVLSAAAAEPALTAQMAANGNHGFRLFLDGMPLSYGSRISCVAPGWKEAYFRSIPYPGRSPVKFTKGEGAFTQSIPAVSEAVAALDEYSINYTGNQAVITAEISLRQPKPAVVEHCALILNPRILAGADYRITTPDGKVQNGIIPAGEPGDASTSLLPDFTQAVFSGNAGVLTVEVLEGAPLSLDDRRARSFSAYGSSFLFLCTDSPVSMEKPWRQVVRVTFANPVPQPPRQLAAATPVVGKITRSATDSAPPFPLLPMPARYRENGEKYQVKSGDRFIVSGGHERLMRHATRLAGDWQLKAENGTAKSERGIFVDVGSDPEDESYTLTVNASGAILRAKGERGGFYGLQTLRGLEHNGVFKGADIADSPDFKLRAIHAMADSGAREHLGNLIEKVLAPLKINTLILECPYVQWDALEGQHHPRGMTKAQLAELLAIARENYIDVYPLIPTMSHAEWFFNNGKNLDMLDNPKDRRSYNSLHPGVYPLLTRLFNEVIEAFGNPRYFHISHDELIGDHPVHPDGRQAGIAKLFYDDVMWHYNFFKSRGITMMMWQDMLVSKQETNPVSVANARGGTEKLRARLPKDIVICVWNYDNRLKGEFPEVDRFAEDGFPVVGAGWHSRGNLEALSRKCFRVKAQGMIETTWHNKFGSELLIHTQYRQITSYVRAASLFWNSAYSTEKFDAAGVLVDLLASDGRAASETLEPLPLKANLELACNEVDFSAVSGDTVTSADGVVFALARQDGKLAGCSVRSLLHPDLPAKARIPVKRHCRKLYLLHTALNETLDTEGRTVKLVVRYTDGSLDAFYPRNAIDIGYGGVPAFKDDGKPVARIYEVGTPFAPWTRLLNHRNVVSWRNPNGKTARLWYLEWQNPHPEKEVDHLLIEARNHASVYALLALTAGE